MPALTPDQIDDAFTYHAPNAEQSQKYMLIREIAKDLALTILRSTPVCEDQTAAIRLLREAVMTANAAIALDGAI